MKQSETKKNITNIVNDYSQEFGIAPQFVEKDYYVVKVLSEIRKINEHIHYLLKKDEELEEKEKERKKQKKQKNIEDLSEGEKKYKQYMDKYISPHYDNHFEWSNSASRLKCPSKFRDKPEGCERNLGVVTLKSEHFAGGVDTAAKCETRLDSRKSGITGAKRNF